MKVCLTVRFENLCDGSLHIGSRVEATRGQRTPCPRTLHLNIGQLSRRELSLYANSDICVMVSVVSRSGDGEMVW